MRVLQLTLFKRFFDEIAAGLKREEYREIKEYWTKRLIKEYDVIEFRNGYAANAPMMRVEYCGYEIKTIVHPITGNEETVYALRLGRVIDIKNYIPI